MSRYFATGYFCQFFVVREVIHANQKDLICDFSLAISLFNGQQSYIFLFHLPSYGLWYDLPHFHFILTAFSERLKKFILCSRFFWEAIQRFNPITFPGLLFILDLEFISHISVSTSSYIFFCLGFDVSSVELMPC